MILRLAETSAKKGKNNVAFLAYFLLGRQICSTTCNLVPRGYKMLGVSTYDIQQTLYALPTEYFLFTIQGLKRAKAGRCFFFKKALKGSPTVTVRFYSSILNKKTSNRQEVTKASENGFFVIFRLFLYLRFSSSKIIVPVRAIHSVNQGSYSCRYQFFLQMHVLMTVLCVS